MELTCKAHAIIRHRIRHYTHTPLYAIAYAITNSMENLRFDKEDYFHVLVFYAGYFIKEIKNFFFPEGSWCILQNDEKSNLVFICIVSFSSTVVMFLRIGWPCMPDTLPRLTLVKVWENSKLRGNTRPTRARDLTFSFSQTVQDAEHIFRSPFRQRGVPRYNYYNLSTYLSLPPHLFQECYQMVYSLW